MSKSFTRWIVIILFLLTSILLVRKNLDQISVVTNCSKSCILKSKAFIELKTALIVYKLQYTLQTIGSIPFLISENNQLKKNLEKYDDIFNQLQKITKENEQLKTVLNFTNNNYYKWYSTQLLLVIENNYLSKAIIGSNKNTQINQLVIGSKGSVIGQVHKIINNVSIITLITDISSKLSVISSNNIKCMIAGNGYKQYLSVLYVADEDIDQLHVGDVLFVNKDNFTKIPVAIITSINNDVIQAKPAEKIQNNSIVSIIQPSQIKDNRRIK